MPSIPQQRRMELSSIRRCFITYRESNANTDFPTLYSSLHFNQRTRMGCDTLSCGAQTLSMGFNPRTRIGCDGLPKWLSVMTARFQSTHPHRVRRASKPPNVLSPMFQSTHPHRVRHRSVSGNNGSVVFQSTHPHRVRLKSFFTTTKRSSFNPRTRIGCDSSSSLTLRMSLVSIHAPA